MEKALTYSRAPESRNKAVPYETKFANFIELCEKAKSEGARDVVITWPWIIGDTYEEVIESLSRLGDAGLVLHVIQRGDDDPISVVGAVLN